MSGRTRSQWEDLTAANPAHSTWYVERFRTLAAEGADIFGEARLIDAMLERGSRVLDAGCGPGRVGGYLHRAGHVVVGVDVDPVLIAAAEQDYPGPSWLVGDLAEVDLPGRGIAADFDAIVCAGNVMTFLAPPTRVATLTGFARHLAPAGRAVVGFGADRGYEFAEFLADAETAGLTVDSRFSTWDLRPFSDESDFMVAVLSRAAASGQIATA
ncbi:class I SAM-dependent methyltransferase [Nocardia goodfellowii]|uniref:SAM-dependent methyltransferase n=1 Tax=Nocardia goodfellowii TaxID=882446 RepID=A0ABS4QDS2_9NOCA|nr:class I SAM-dependent methyltransferase [Nocardia goodfellowii]MBP2189703.1 SAM-dependent methyltransferase [Nocardia goodfellowii]